MFRARDRGIHGANGSTQHRTLRGTDAVTGEFFTYESGLDLRDAVTGRILEAKNTTFNLGKIVDRRVSAGGYEKHSPDLAYAFLGLATYDTDTLGVQARPAGSDPL